MSLEPWPSITKELFKVRITADVVLDTQPVFLAFMPENTKPTDEDMHVATWQGDSSTSIQLPSGQTAWFREAGVMVGPDTSIQLVPGGYTVWYKVTDNPEEPWRPCGWVRVS